MSFSGSVGFKLHLVKNALVLVFKNISRNGSLYLFIHFTLLFIPQIPSKIQYQSIVKVPVVYSVI